MQAHEKIDMQSSSQVGPKTETAMPFVINGCTVSFSSTVKGTDEPIKAIKEILLSTYRTKQMGA